MAKAKEKTKEPTAEEIEAAAAKKAGMSVEEYRVHQANLAPKDDKLLPTRGVVARGKTVTTERGTFRQGEVVISTPDEIKRLRRLKFLVDPRETLLPMGNGPRFFQEDAAAKDAPEPS